MRSIRNIRLKHYDYSQNGYYFVTICSNYQCPHLEEFSREIRNALDALKGIEGITVDYYSILPSHMHIIIILQESKLGLGEIVRRFKSLTSKETGIKLWQPNYYEHVIRNEKALQRIREYIINNPLKEKIKFNQIYET